MQTHVRCPIHTWVPSVASDQCARDVTRVSCVSLILPKQSKMTYHHPLALNASSIHSVNSITPSRSRFSLSVTETCWPGENVAAGRCLDSVIVGIVTSALSSGTLQIRQATQWVLMRAWQARQCETAPIPIAGFSFRGNFGGNEKFPAGEIFPEEETDSDEY
jgi:hypothetical protein